MVEDIKDNIKKIKNTDLEYLLGVMEENIREIGLMENKMEKGYIDKKMEFKDKVYGKTV
jgi:hypothetical protein